MSGQKVQVLVCQLQSVVAGKLRVLIGFTLSDVSAESFPLKARLLHMAWARVEGRPFCTVNDGK